MRLDERAVFEPAMQRVTEQARQGRRLDD